MLGDIMEQYDINKIVDFGNSFKGLLYKVLKYHPKYDVNFYAFRYDILSIIESKQFCVWENDENVSAEDSEWMFLSQTMNSDRAQYYIKKWEFDKTVAQHARIWRSSARIFQAEIIKHYLAIFLTAIHLNMFDF